MADSRGNDGEMFVVKVKTKAQIDEAFHSLQNKNIQLILPVICFLDSTSITNMVCTILPNGKNPNYHHKHASLRWSIIPLGFVAQTSLRRLGGVRPPQMA